MHHSKYTERSQNKKELRSDMNRLQRTRIRYDPTNFEPEDIENLKTSREILNEGNGKLENRIAGGQFVARVKMKRAIFPKPSTLCSSSY